MFCMSVYSKMFAVLSCNNWASIDGESIQSLCVLSTSPSEICATNEPIYLRVACFDKAELRKLERKSVEIGMLLM